MKMTNKPTNQEFETILDYCIDEMQAGKSLEECLAQFPEYRDELKPMLETVSMVGKIEAPQPSAATINNALFEIGRQAGQEKSSAETTGIFLQKFIRKPWFARTISVAMVLVILFFGLSTASADSIPGDILYPFKKLTENIQFLLTTGEQNKAELRLTFSEKRLRELSDLYRQTGQVDENLIQAMLQEAEVALEAPSMTGETPSYFMTRARYLNETQRDYLNQLQPHVKGQALDVVNQAIQTCTSRGEQMNQMMQQMMRNMPMMQDSSGNNNMMQGMQQMMNGGGR